MQITIFKSGSLIGNFIGDIDAIALVRCDDKYGKKFINNMNEKKLLDLEKRSKRWKYCIDIEWITHQMPSHLIY